MSDQVWLSVKAFAAHIDVGERTIRRWIAEGAEGLEVLRIGGIIRVRAKREAIGNDWQNMPSSHGSETGAR